MSRRDQVVIDSRASAAFGLPRSSPPGAYWLLDDGQVVRVETNGRVEQLVRAGLPFGRSIASDPAAKRWTL